MHAPFTRRRLKWPWLDSCPRSWSAWALVLTSPNLNPNPLLLVWTLGA